MADTPSDGRSSKFCAPSCREECALDEGRFSVSAQSFNATLGSRCIGHAMKPAAVLILLIIGGLLVTVAAEAQQGTTQVEIANMPVGASPQGFEFTLTGGGPVSAWKVIPDATAAGQKAIAQTSQDRTDYRFPLAVYLPLSAQNVDVTVHFKPVAGEVDQAGGIA